VDAYIPLLFPSLGETVTALNETTYASATPLPIVTAHLILQDYRDFAIVHNGSVNVLMADGSVRSFQDVNGDGYLNPGFPADTSVSPASITGYTDGLVEINSSEMFTGTFLRKAEFAKGNTE